MAMKEVDLKITANAVTVSVSFEDMAEAVQFGQACATLIVKAASGAPDEVQQRAGWIARTLRRE